MKPLTRAYGSAGAGGSGSGSDEWPQRQQRHRRRFLYGRVPSSVLALVLLLLMVFACDHAVHGSGFGRCPKYPSMPKFNMTRFLGVWYELEHSFYLPEIISSCTKLSFKEGADDGGLDDNQLDITVRSVNQWTHSASESKGHATTESTRSSIMDFRLASRLPNAIARWMPGSGKYQVLFTDYDRFAILWSCTSLAPIGHADQIWLLGRERHDFEVDMRSRIHDTLRRLGLEPDRLVLSKNKDCPEDDDDANEVEDATGQA